MVCGIEKEKKKKSDGRSSKMAAAAPLKNDQQAPFLSNCFSDFEFFSCRKLWKKIKIDKALKKLLQKSDFEACIMSNAYAIAFEIEFQNINGEWFWCRAEYVIFKVTIFLKLHSPHLTTFFKLYEKTSLRTFNEIHSNFLLFKDWCHA